MLLLGRIAIFEEMKQIWIAQTMRESVILLILLASDWDDWDDRIKLENGQDINYTMFCFDVVVQCTAMITLNMAQRAADGKGTLAILITIA